MRLCACVRESCLAVGWVLCVCCLACLGQTCSVTQSQFFFAAAYGITDHAHWLSIVFFALPCRTGNVEILGAMLGFVYSGREMKKAAAATTATVSATATVTGVPCPTLQRLSGESRWATCSIVGLFAALVSAVAISLRANSDGPMHSCGS